MSALCDALQPILHILSDALGKSPESVSADGDDSCSIEYKDVRIEFIRDTRDRIVSSSLYFPDDKLGEFQLFTHIVKRFLSKDRDIRGEATAGDNQLREECRSVAEILAVINGGRVGATDLYYFQRGYNAAYTDYTSGAWN